MRKILLYIALSSMLFGCTKQDELLNLLPSEGQNEIAQPITRSLTFEEAVDNEAILGKRLENSYTVTNMQIAYDKVISTTRAIPNRNKLRVTHRYVKFMPKDSTQLEKIESDTTLELYMYPLDYEILSGGTVYNDPSVPEGQPQYRYAAVPANYTFPDSVAYDVSANLFLPAEGTPMQNLQYGLTEKNVAQLELTAEQQVGDIAEIQPLSATRYHPSGQIRVWDDALQDYIPLEGVKVRARRWFRTLKANTDEWGIFSCSGTFERPCNYSIAWERAHWDIRNGIFGQAFYNGPKKAGSWYLQITGNKSLRYATIHRAAFMYWYGPAEEIDNLNRPLHSRKVKLCYMHEEGENKSGDYWSSIGAGILPDIRIYGRGAIGWYPTYNIFATTIHELTHAAHCKSVGQFNYWFTSGALKESWATYVEMKLLDKHYAKYRYYGFHKDVIFRNGMTIHKYFLPDEWNKQDWKGYSSSKKYTPLFIDLADYSNQREWAMLSKRTDYMEYPDDRIVGFTPVELQALLIKNKSVKGLFDEIKRNKDLYPNQNVTDDSVDALYKFWDK